MKVDCKKKNPALSKLLKDIPISIALDANIFIVPKRNTPNKPSIPDEFFFEGFLKPLLTSSLSLVIHEAVLDELVEDSVYGIANEFIKADNSNLSLLSDAHLKQEEAILRDTFEKHIAAITNYSPLDDNKEDRGEVKTLAHLAVKGRGLFLSNDFTALRLVKDTTALETSLDELGTLSLYEILYYLTKKTSASKPYKAIYKYSYCLTQREKDCNPSWGRFIESMNLLYDTENT